MDAPVLKTSPNCSECPIRHRAVCARCEPDELEQLENIKYYRSFEAGQTVVWSSDRMDFVGSVVSGIATLTLGSFGGDLMRLTLWALLAVFLAPAVALTNAIFRDPDDIRKP